MTARRTSAPAALVLGVFAGVLAALSIFPAAIPLTLRLSSAERDLALRHALSTASIVAALHEEGTRIPIDLGRRLEIDHLEIVGNDDRVLHEEGLALPLEISQVACTNQFSWGERSVESGRPVSQNLKDADGNTWATACVAGSGFRVVTAWKPSYEAPNEMAVMVLAIATIVGLVTALGTLRLLAPLSRVGTALDRVGSGERGVRISATGMAEMDELVERLNAAARSMEAREEAILSRIQVVQRMAHLVAHEIRNPLQSLELLTSLIASEDNSAERQELANSIHLEVRALDMVVDRLLRQGVDAGGLKLDISLQPLQPLIDKVIALRKPEANAQGIRLEVGTIPSRPLPMDQSLLGRSLENLVLNAMQAVPPKRGIVRISASEDEESMCIVVEDNGPGVPEAFGNAIYQPNISGRTGGTGLGLSLVKGVLDAHGGSIHHERSPLGGARFIARLPLREIDVGR